MRYSLALLILAAVPCWCQTSTTGKAETTGSCSPAVSGSNNKFTLNCPGVSKEDLNALVRQNQGNVKVTLAKMEECKQEVINLGVQQTKRFDEQAVRLTAIADALEGLNLTPQKLLARYPLGYVIFDVDYRNDVFPYRSEAFLNKFDLDWSAVHVEPIPCPTPGPTCQPDEIALTLPDAGLKNQPKKYTNLAMAGPRKVGLLQGGTIVNNLMIQAEILAVRADGIVFVIGLRELVWNWPFPKPGTANPASATSIPENKLKPQSN